MVDHVDGGGLVVRRRRRRRGQPIRGGERAFESGLEEEAVGK